MSEKGMGFASLFVMFSLSFPLAFQKKTFYENNSDVSLIRV